MRVLILFICLLSFANGIAQTGIGTTSPNTSAKLDVFSDNKGFLPPRVSLTDAYDQTTIPTPATGLLVYCKGDAGLAAGYYFWNGNAWATIATAGGSGSVAAEYGTQILGSNVAISSGTPTDVLSFTLPSAGTWEVISFVRAQSGSAGFAGEYAIYDASGTLVTNSEILVAYGQYASTGTGVIRITTTGAATYKLKAWATTSTYTVYTDLNGRTGVTWKKISGNAAVTGQSVDYGIARYTGADGSSLTNLAIVNFDATAAGNLTWSGNKFTLKANRTYEIESGLSIFYGSGAGVAGRFQIYDYTNSNALANGLFMSQNGAGSYAQSANTPMKCIVTPTSDIQVGVRMLDFYGPTSGPGIIGNTVQTGTTSSPNSSYFIVKQIGSSAIVNPWTLAGTSTYNTTGNVGIGTISPTEKLEVSGNVKATNFIGTASSALSAPTNITYGVINVPQNLSVAAGGDGFTNLVDIPLPSAGTYKITYIARVSVNSSATLAVLLLRNGSNAQVGGSEATPIFNLAGVQVMSTMTTYVTISSAETYKFSAWIQAGAGTLQIINDGNGRSKVIWEKIQ
jgi:hypothetical protein